MNNNHWAIRNSFWLFTLHFSNISNCLTMGDSYLASRWMDELLIFAAMSVASSLGCLHLIMLDNEEREKSIGRYTQFLSKAHSFSCPKAFWDSSLSSGSWIIHCNKNLTLKNRTFFTVTICQKLTRLQIKYIHLNSAETDGPTDRFHHTSNHKIIQHQVRPSSFLFLSFPNRIKLHLGICFCVQFVIYVVSMCKLLRSQWPQS